MSAESAQIPPIKTDDAIWAGVSRLLDDYIAVSADDFAVVLYTPDSWQSAVWVSSGLEFSGVPVVRVCMKPLNDAGFPERLATRLPAADKFSGRLVVIALERDTMSHAEVVNRALSKYPLSRRVCYRVISASEELFSCALHVTPLELTQRNAKVLNFLSEAECVRITSIGGTNLCAWFDSGRYRWISNRGLARAGRNVILPAGEVATYPSKVTGTLVADFAFNVNAITSRDARLSSRPVIVEIKDSKATSWHCDDSDVLRFVDDCLGRRHANNVGELGFGTNPHVVDPIPHNSHVNERKPGVHLGFGQHNQLPGKVSYQCPIHLDLIARGAEILTPDNRKLDLENLGSTNAQIHPAFPDDEDVFAPDAGIDADDCCGILTNEGLHTFDGH